MDRYQKVEKPKPELPINENEVRITASGPIRNYISYATSLLQDKHANEIVLKAMGQAISKTVAIAEIIKKRIPRLHQETAIGSECITDVWEPIEEGLVPVEMTRHVSMISITLSARELNRSSPGYQVPQNFEQQKPQNRYQQQERRPGRPRNFYNGPNEDSYGQESYGGYSHGRGSYGQGRGRGSGRGQSWGRGGGYNNYQDNDGYSNWGRGGGRGRGWGRDRGWGYHDGYNNYQGGGYERGGKGGGYERGRGGGRGYGGCRERMGGRGRSRGGDSYN